jgi:hypothetical protein
MAKTAKPKVAPMHAEVQAMIDVRRDAERRGHFEPAGRLLHLVTARGTIHFPVVNGEGVGPDVGFAMSPLPGIVPKDVPDPAQGTFADWNTLLVLGMWAGLPPLRKDSPDFCPRCLHACDICTGTGKELCKGVDCGGNGWVPGNWLLCPGPGCSAETGKFNPECVTCRGAGQVRQHSMCPMCKGTKVMTCQRCRGTKKFATGYRNGSIDYQSPRCRACDGTGHKVLYVMQDVNIFTNARLKTQKPKDEWLVLGPIHAFCIATFQGQQRVFDVSPDAKGDYLVLIVPRSPSGKAYLVGGVVRERQAHAAVAS